MKKIYPTLAMTSIVLALLLPNPVTFTSSGQQSYTYHFSSSPINSSPPGGPVMVPVGTPITPVSVVIPATTCSDEPEIDLTYFPHNAGFKAKSFFTDMYSIEMIFRFQELNGYNRIIDFSNSISDNGIYTFSDCLNFYPTGNIGPCPGAFDTTNYTQIVITRNNTSKEMNIYVKGELFTTHVDDTDHYVIGAAPNDSITFFKDDVAFANEASPGHVALIRMCDCEFSPQEIADSYNNFCERLTGTQTINNNSDVSVYPNPATDQLTLQLDNADLTQEITFTIFSMLGQTLLNVPITNELTGIDVSSFPSGVCFYQIQMDEKITKTGKILLQGKE